MQKKYTVRITGKNEYRKMKQLMIRANALDLIVIRFSLNGITLFNGISAHARPLIVKCEEKNPAFYA